MNVQEQLLQEKIDPFLTEDAVSTLVSQVYDASVRARPGRVLTGGCWNRVISTYVDDGDRGEPAGPPSELVFKISPNDHDQRLRREFEVLEYFAANTTMPVPKPFLLSDSGEPIPGTVLVMSKISGAVLHSAYTTLTPRDQTRISGDITRAVIDLHENTLQGFGGVELPPGDREDRWADFWLPRFDTAMGEARKSGHIDESFFQRVDAVRPQFEAELDAVRLATVTHYDIWSGNVMVSRSGAEARVSGFIDIPGFAADYARELSFMLMFGVADEAFLATYDDHHGLDDGFACRVNMYNLKMQTKHITMYPSEYYYRQGAESCLSYLEEYLSR